MLRHSQLSDPITRTRDMTTEEFTKYINIREQQTEVTPTDPDVVNKIHDIFYETHAKQKKEDLDRVWDFAGGKIKKNAGLAQFVLDYGGAESDFFFPWLIEVYTSPSAALEMAYGAGRDLKGNWIKKVPEDDKIDFFVRNDPTFVYNRERQLYVADLAATIQDKSTKEKRSKIIDFGAGQMAWARWHGFEFKPELQDILAFDMDTSIVPKKLFDKDLKDLNLKFEIGDMREQIANPECMGADLIILGGVASYYPMDMFGKSVITPAHGLLKPGGVFFFDLQLDCPYLKRSMRIFDWPEIKLTKGVTNAIEAVEAVRKKLWEQGIKFGAEYVPDTYNEIPSSIMITFTKI